MSSAIQAETAAQVNVVIAANGMEAHVKWSPPGLPGDDLMFALLGQFQRLKVPCPTDTRPILSRIEAARAAAVDGWCQAVALSGSPASETVDEQIQWARDFFNAPYVVDEGSGRIDYRERAANSTVKADETIARVLPGKLGPPGRDVFGRAIPPRPIRKAGLLGGRNIRFDPPTRRFFSKCAGRLRFSGNMLAVDDIMEIPGSVGLASGNIRFTGQVCIAQDVEDMGTVEADGGIDVGNVVGMAKLASGGEVRVRKGIAGKGVGQVIAKGGVIAGHISNAQIQAEGDIDVHREIVQAELRCRGSVRVKSGRIVGGTVIALGEIVVAEAGSEAGVATLLAAGEDYALPTALAEQQAKLSVVSARAEELRGQMTFLAGRGRDLTAQQRETMTELMFQSQSVEATLAECRQRTDQRVFESKRLAHDLIVVSRAAHPGVTFRIDGVSLKVGETLAGPIKVVLVQNESGKKLAIRR